MTATQEDITTSDVTQKDVKLKIIWRNVIVLGIIHCMGLYGLKVMMFDSHRWTFMWHLFSGYLAGLGVTGGAHRLWTHRSYKAKVPLRIILAFFYLGAGMNPIFDWVRDHRVHHKFSDTDADPHNSKRGLFFSHVGWLMQKKHPEVIRKGREIDMSDIQADPVVMFQEKYFIPLQLMCSFILPTSVPCLLWGESVWNSFFALMCRWMLLLNSVWSVNSFAHIYGYRPYNKKINPAENLAVSMIALGEGWHNYHHTFPWDYKTAELGMYGTNFTTAFIDFFAWIGWAYDLKQPSKKLVQRVIEQSGDGSHGPWGHSEEEEEVFKDEDKVKGI